MADEKKTLLAPIDVRRADELIQAAMTDPIAREYLKRILLTSFERKDMPL